MKRKTTDVDNDNDNDLKHGPYLNQVNVNISFLY